MDRAPQIDRLLARLAAMASPVIQVWGWPGSGRAELLAALVASSDRGGEARSLAPEDVTVDGVRAAVASGARWIVATGLPRRASPEALIADLAEALPTDRRLVFATRRRVPAPEISSGLIAPGDLALTPDEAAALAHAVGAPMPDAETARRVTAASDGWYRPLRLASEASAASGEPIPDDPASLAALPAVDRFLRREVLADLSPRERSVLLGGGDGGRGAGADRDRLRELDEELGLLVGGSRPPHLLRAVLARDAPTPSARERGAGEAGDAAPPGPPLDEDAGEARFRLHLLGRPEVWRRDPDGGWRRLHWPLKRAFRALAYLASEPERSAAREDLVEALWPDDAARSVQRNFHPTLSHLRRGLREGAPEGDDLDPLALIDGVYALAPELGWWTDLEALARLDEAGASLSQAGRDDEAIEVWRAAWRLYRGHFLEGSYEPWVLRRREDQQRRYLRLLQSLAAALVRRERAAEAIDAYRAVLVEDPLQEAAHAALMRLYAHRGRRDLVRRQYERLTVLLRDELGVEPLPETTREYHRLMTERETGAAGDG